jgi:hypothetical protein
MKARFFGVLSAALVAVLLAGPCYASTLLIGDFIQAEYRFPTAGTAYSLATASPNPFTVGAGVETVIDVEGVTFLSVDFDAASLLITLDTVLSNPTWTLTEQNGPAFTALSGGPFPAISTVISSNLWPVAAFLSGGTLFVNWAGMPYHDGDTVLVTFDAVSAVPLPAAFPLFAGGLGMIGWLGWRRRKNQEPAPA